MYTDVNYIVQSRDLLKRMMAAEEQRDASLKDVSRRIFAQFDERHDLWDAAVACLAVVDVLLAMAAFSSSGGDQAICRPKILSARGDDRPPYLKLVAGVHPCHSQLFTSCEFIANDVAIGCTDDGEPCDASLKLVTGPNMGGKSTLMRQVGSQSRIESKLVEFHSKNSYL